MAEKSMARRCSVCPRPDRPEIDRALVGGAGFAALARDFAVSADAVERHAKTHLPAAIVKAQEAVDVAHGDALLRQIRDLQGRTMTLLDGAERDGDLRGALVAIHQARENVALLSRLLAELGEGPGGGELTIVLAVDREVIERDEATGELTVRREVIGEREYGDGA